jgi:hypothetical protein
MLSGAGATKLAESIRTSRAEMQDLSQRLRVLEERMGKGHMLDEEVGGTRFWFWF